MKVSDFDYELPADRIAQRPLARRDASKLLVLDATSGTRTHRCFVDLIDLVRPEDLLVFNDTRVLPARLIGRKPSGGRVELLLLQRLSGGGSREAWSCLLQASRKPAIGTRLEIADGFTARVEARTAEGWRVELECGCGDVPASLEHFGRMPLPPYIRRDGDGADAEDRDRYQTIYARHDGAVAAPTAGLHFTSELMGRLAAGGVKRAFVTLHVGTGTFLPVRAARIEDHRMHEERFELSGETAAAVGAARNAGGRIIAVGTTVVRVLETCADASGLVEPRCGRSDLFIRPGYRFKTVDGLITNFHLPRSTLLMLVAALAGRESILGAYAEALERGYRFYSYGDAMFIRGGGAC